MAVEGGIAYRLKRIEYMGNMFPILMQNENGPCPLLALSNVLILRGSIYIHPDKSEVTFVDLTAQIADYLLDANPLPENAEFRANVQQNLTDGMALFPKLNRGLDVNVHFGAFDYSASITPGFDYSEDLLMFDLLNVRLVHGWLIDPQDSETARVVGALSYNSLVEKVIEFNSFRQSSGDIGLPSPLGATIPGYSSPPPSPPAVAEDASRFDEQQIQASTASLSLTANERDPASPPQTESALQPLHAVAACSIAPGSTSATEPPLGTQCSPSSAVLIPEPQAIGVASSASADTCAPPMHAHEGIDPFPSREDASHNAPPVVATSPSPPPGHPTTFASADLAPSLDEPPFSPPAAVHQSISLPVSSPPPVTTQLDEPSFGRTDARLVEAMIAKDWLNRSASQLTYYGLEQLHEHTKEHELLVFFRNNHFSTLTKHAGELYLLATDFGYLHEPDVVWERLNQVDGDSLLCDASFRVIDFEARNAARLAAAEAAEAEAIADAADAEQMLLAQLPGPPMHDVARSGAALPPHAYSTPVGGVDDRYAMGSAGQLADPDYALALQLQREEEAAVQQEAEWMRQQQQQQQHPQAYSHPPPSAPPHAYAYPARNYHPSATGYAQAQSVSQAQTWSDPNEFAGGAPGRSGTSAQSGSGGGGCILQ